MRFLLQLPAAILTLLAAVPVVSVGNQEGEVPLGHDARLSQGVETASKLSEGEQGAYVTLCYLESYVLGVRVLGKSLRETGTTRDMVALVTDGVSDGSIETLQEDGWTIKHVDLVQNPGTGPKRKGKGGYPQRFWAVYTKLMVYSLTEYSTVVYLDADILVLDSLDHLFGCTGFCAVMRAGERFNSGLMVLRPSQSVHSDIMDRIWTTPSYTGGDQGFLNEYYKDIINAPLFEPGNSLAAAAAASMKLPMMRLRTEYNCDIGAFVINAGLWHQAEKPKVLHFTLGPFKPWHWWMSWLTDQHQLWLQVKARLGPDAHGYTGGRRMRTTVARWLLCPVPVAVWAWLLHAKAWGSGLQHLVCVVGLRRMLAGWFSKRPGTGSVLYAWASGRGTAPLGHGGSVVRQPKGLANAASIVGIGSAVVSLLAAVVLVVPHDIDPLIAWVLVYEWSLLGLTLAAGRFLRMCRALGWSAGAKHSRQHDAFADYRDSHGSNDVFSGGISSAAGKVAPSKAVLDAWGVTIQGSFISGLCLVLSPWLSRLLDINDLVAKILITTFSGVFAVIVLCHSLGDMALAWYSSGVKDATRGDLEA